MKYNIYHYEIYRHCHDCSITVYRCNMHKTRLYICDIFTDSM